MLNVCLCMVVGNKMPQMNDGEEHDRDGKGSENADKEALFAPGVGDWHVFWSNFHELIQMESKERRVDED